MKEQEKQGIEIKKLNIFMETTRRETLLSKDMPVGFKCVSQRDGVVENKINEIIEVVNKLSKEKYDE